MSGKVLQIICISSINLIKKGSVTSPGWFLTEKFYEILYQPRIIQTRLKGVFFASFGKCVLVVCTIQLRPPSPKSIEKFTLWGAKQFWVGNFRRSQGEGRSQTWMVRQGVRRRMGQNSPFKIKFVFFLVGIQRLSYRPQESAPLPFACLSCIFLANLLKQIFSINQPFSVT